MPEEQPMRMEEPPVGQPPGVEATRWITGPLADPLREPPWLTMTHPGRRQERSRVLPRPRRFRRLTRWARLRSALILLVIALTIGLSCLMLELGYSEFGAPLSVPRQLLPSWLGTPTGVPSPGTRAPR
jgi:hypothetical protein